MRIGALVVTLVVAGCKDSLVSAVGLEVIPNPARAGENVTFTLGLSVVPRQRFTLTIRIDGLEHRRETRDELVDGVVILELGDAAGLIATYGLGVHEARVEVRLDNGGRTASSSRTFELQET